MKLTPEQLAEWKDLVPKLLDDSSDHLGITHSTDMPPQHTVNFRHAKNAHEAAWAITKLIADLEEATATRGNGVLVPSPKLKEMQAEIRALRKQLAEAQAFNAQVLSVAEKMRCAGGAQEFQHWFDEMKFLSRKRATSALDAANQPRITGDKFVLQETSTVPDFGDLNFEVEKFDSPTAKGETR